jgi:hypothetical protein
MPSGISLLVWRPSKRLPLLCLNYQLYLRLCPLVSYASLGFCEAHRVVCHAQRSRAAKIPHLSKCLRTGWMRTQRQQAG